MKIVILIEGGCLRAVHADDADVEVELFDMDGLDDAGIEEQILEEYEKAIQQKYEVF